MWSKDVECFLANRIGFWVSSSVYLKEISVIMQVSVQPCTATMNPLLPTDLKMKREKESGRDNQDSNQHESLPQISIRDHPGLGQKAHSQHKHSGYNYVIPFASTARERHEKKYIANALAEVPYGAFVLNWPCENGRLLPFLKQLGYSVTCADSSSHAVAQARFYGGFLGEGCIDDTDDFQVVDLLQAGFEDDYFSAAIVNHLFYYVPESQMRQRILKELGRICSGPIVVSFFHIVAAEEKICRVNDAFCKYRIQSGISLNRRKFAQEVNECGLIVTKWVPKYRVTSKQTSVVLVRDKGF